MLNPHLFTHLFYEGVIVSTRKLVYDSGSNEEAIKSLMQAQHKAVMKDLRKGTFDDKIDQYLGGTPGLEPRAGGPAKPLPRGERAPTEADELVAQAAMDGSGASPIEIVNEELSEPIELPLKQGVPAVARTDTGDRTIPVDTHRAKLPPPPSVDIDAPTLQSGSGDMASAINQANAGSAPPRTKTSPKVSRSQVVDSRAPTYHSPAQGDPRESAPVIEISIDEDEISARLRGPRDTAVQDDAPPQQQRPASHGAATLPKSPSRPPPPMVSARPPTQDRKREDSTPVEIHSPAPPSVEPPPGERSERPGQYSMSRKEGAAPMREKTGRIAAMNPASAANQPPPRRPPSGGSPVVPQPQPQSGRDSGQIPRVPQGSRPQQPPPRPSQPAVQHPPPAVARTSTPPAGSRVGTPQNRSAQTAPIQNRTPSPAAPAPGSGVVMTRPAVIVGAPPKPPAVPQQQRVRKAREDEGRGFGQGLISEKSLDEVILAYLSEDAEDK